MLEFGIKARHVLFIRKSPTDPWVKGVAGLSKQLDKQLKEIGLEKIDAKPGTLFNPEFHQAVQFDESTNGDKEVIAEELRAGYTLNGSVIRDAMVKVARQ